MQTITDDTYKAELAVSEPVLLDFWAAWCAPCRAIAPAVEAIAAQYQGRVKVGKVDADANPLLTVKYDIRSLPTLALVVDGRTVDRLVGVATPAQIQSMIEHYFLTFALDEVTHAL